MKYSDFDQDDEKSCQCLCDACMDGRHDVCAQRAFDWCGYSSARR